MEQLISKQLLQSVQSAYSKESSKLFSEAQAKIKRKQYASEVSIFLSHKHDEKVIVEQVVTLLSKLGVQVYLDWEDDGIPTSTSGSTAVRIKTKIKEKDKFILLATEKAVASKWCNWELGYGDACKYIKNIAIMPITESQDGKFSGSEYLQIYPVITSKYLHFLGTYYVEFENRKIELENWLKGYSF